uniref:Protein kinase domain-containing protein n=1 Tax=Elaeophora elaphi TaxID=1147741 RepID=A0A0R3RIM1_9BILA
MKAMDDLMASTAAEEAVTAFAAGTSQTGDINTTTIQSTAKPLLKHSRQQQPRKLSIKPSSKQDSKRKEQGEKVVSITELSKHDRVNKWLILELIGKGAFGCVYKKPLLVEKHVLELAKQAESKHICRLIGYGNYLGFEYIVMTLVGKSLRDILMERKRKRLSAGCVISVGLQCVEAIEELHRVGFIHRDIKPSNFATGRNDIVNGVRKIFLIDFGLSYHYVDSNDQLKHIKRSISFKGTLRYAPLGCHRRRPPGRRDDLESWMYQQIEFTKGYLPWKNLDDEQAIMIAKESIRTNDGMRKLLRSCPKKYMEIMKYICKLKHTSRPDYDLIYKVPFI